MDNFVTYCFQRRYVVDNLLITRHNLLFGLSTQRPQGFMDKETYVLFMQEMNKYAETEGEMYKYLKQRL